MTYMAYNSKQLEIEDKANTTLVISKWTTCKKSHVIQLNLGMKYFWKDMDFYILLKILVKTANICLGKVVLKKFWTRLEDVFSVTVFCFPRRLQDGFAKRLLKNVLKTSWRSLEENVWQNCFEMSWGHLKVSFEYFFGKYLTSMPWKRLAR